MAIALAKVADGENVIGKHRHISFDVTLDNSYPTGGYAITAAAVGLRRIIRARAEGGNSAAAVLNFHYDTVNNKLMALYPTGGATASPAALADPLVTSGASTASAVNATTPAITPGQAKQVANASDLSTMVVRLEVEGE